MTSAKKNVIGLVVAASLASVAPLAAAVDVGVGVSLNNNGGGDGGYGASLPLRFGSFTVEPELTFYDSTQDTSYPSSPTSNYTTDRRQYTLKTGVFWRRPLVPSMETYVGGRVGYVKNKYSNTYPASPASNYSDDSSGYFLGPVLGAEYFFNKHFSMGLDVALLYESTSGDTVNGGSASSTDGYSINYQTRVKLRSYF